MAAKISRAVGAAANPVPLRLIWEGEQSQGRAIEPRALAVDLAALEPGRYQLSLTAAVAGLAPVSTQREIEIIR